MSYAQVATRGLCRFLHCVPRLLPAYNHLNVTNFRILLVVSYTARHHVAPEGSTATSGRPEKNDTMSLSESFTDLSGAHAPEPPPGPDASTIAPGDPAYVDPDLLKLRRALDGIFFIEGEEHHELRRTHARVYVFKGSLHVPAEEAYAAISARFEPLGYTPMLERTRARATHEVAIAAVPGSAPTLTIRSPWWLHLLLLLVTLFTTTIMGAALNGLPPEVTWEALRTWDKPVLWPAVRDGLPFSLTLLFILGVHEMGHYVAARLHGVRVTLPYFIPLPLPGSLGTLGAVIFIRSPLMNRRALFDVGVAGPLAGLVVALPLFLIGLQQTPTTGLPTYWMNAGIWRVTTPPLLQWIAPLAVDSGMNLDKTIFYHYPMALAAWFGVLLTALNLLPLGQFDGGHVAYALLGKRAWPLALFTFTGLIALSVLGAWFAWLLWAFMGILTGLRHPPPHDDLLPLGRARIVLGIVTAIIFATIFVPVPFYSPF